MREAMDAPLDDGPVDRAPIDPGPALETIDKMYRTILDDTKATHHLKRENKEAWAIVKRVDHTMKAGLKEGLEYEQAVQRVDPKDLEALGQILGGTQVAPDIAPNSAEIASSVQTPEEAVSEASQTLADFEDPTSAISEEEKGEQRKKVVALEQREAASKAVEKAEVPTPDEAVNVLNLPDDANVGDLAQRYRKAVMDDARKAGKGETIKAVAPRTTNELPKGELISAPIFGGRETAIPAPDAPAKPDPMVGPLQPGELSFEDFLNQSRFYRSGKTKNAEVPGGERVILKPESTATNFRENSRNFLKGVYGNYIAKLRKDKSAPDTKNPPAPDAVLTAPQQAEDQSQPEVALDVVQGKDAEQTSFGDVAPANQIALPTDLKSEQELRAMQYDRIPEGTMVSMKAIRASTGEYITIQADARTALRDLDAAEAKYRKLLECLES
jgi:hypothetical protein